MVEIKWLFNFTFMVRSPEEPCEFFLALLFLCAALFFFFWFPFFLPGWTCLPSGDVSVPPPPAAPSSSGSLAAAAAASAAAWRSCSSSSFLRASSSFEERMENFGLCSIFSPSPLKIL